MCSPRLTPRLFILGREIVQMETADELLAVRTEDGEVFIWRPCNTGGFSVRKSWNAGYSDRWPSRVVPLTELGNSCQGIAVDDSQVTESL